MIPIIFEEFTGNAYKNWEKEYQKFYIFGLLEGVMVHEIMDIHPYGKDRDPHNTRNFQKCITRQFPDMDQVHSIIKKELDDNPENWNRPISTIIIQKLRDLCEDRGYIKYSESLN